MKFTLWLCLLEVRNSLEDYPSRIIGDFFSQSTVPFAIMVGFYEITIRRRLL